MHICELCLIRGCYKACVMLTSGFVVAQASCSRREAVKPLAKNEYVDARTCAGCHADIARNYSNTGMARSFYAPDAGASRIRTPGSIVHRPPGIRSSP